MTVETNAINISDLNKAYPRNRDLIKEGDDHIRLIKSVLQNTFPGMDATVEASSEKLNKLNTTFTYTENTLNINNSITVADDKDVDMGGNVITNIGDPVEPTDAVNLRSLQGDLMWPVGSIFMTVDGRDPKNILGFGKWEKFAAGRVIVGTGINTDSENELVTVVNGAKGGTYSTKLVEDNIPSHTHKGTGKASSSGRHNHGFPSGGGSDGSGGRRAISIDVGRNDSHEWMGERNAGTTAVNADGEHTHDVTVTLESTGKGEKFNNVQPYIACNIWVRKADSTT